MQKRHKDKVQYFNEQSYTSEEYVIPFINNLLPITKDISVLEIGCGEGGNLKPFLDMGYMNVVGIDLSKGKIEQANIMFSNHQNKENIKFIAADIYNIDELAQFDIIITRDVIEHIHDQKKFMGFVKKFLKPEGKIFFGFPPWFNPFGGHQQICESKILSKMPFFHILPAKIYRLILKMFGENEAKIRSLLEIKETGITIERFEKILKNTGYQIEKKILYLINPNYEVKFNLKPRRQINIISSIPYLRNFLTTAGYYLISNKKK